MRLKVQQLSQPVHKEIVTALGWTSNNELYTTSDDDTIQRWSANGELLGKVCDLEGKLCTDFHWFPAAPGANKQLKNTSEVFAVSCTDGNFRLISRTGRTEKTVEAHRGAVTSQRWNYEGTALVTAGEDGLVKVWSRSGMLRSTLARSEFPIYSICWGPDSDQILYTSGRDLIIKPLSPSSKQLQWKAHDGPVLKVDWNPVNYRIVSGGEDCRYKVWDSFGRVLYQSKPFEYAVTSVSWCPDGELFAVGSFNTLQLCDKTGWSYSRARPQSGSIVNISWTADGTQLAGAGGNGAVCFGQLVDRRLEWKHLEVCLDENNKIQVRDVLSESFEELDFRDRVVKTSIGFGYLIVATSTQMCIYDIQNWHTPSIFDIKDTVSLIKQCEKYFMIVDSFNGVQLFTYDGRMVCNPKFSGLRTEFLNSTAITLCNDTVAIIDRGDPRNPSRTIRCFETMSGRELGPVTHNLDIVEISLEQTGAATERKVALIDRNRDLYLGSIHRPADMYKLGAMVDTMMWNAQSGMLAVIMDQKFVVYYYPNVVFVDRDLLQATQWTRAGDEFGKNAQFVSFDDTRCAVRDMSGALIIAGVSPYPMLLHEHCNQNEWDLAIRLCRFVKDNSLWACLAAMAINGKELNTAEVAYAAISEIDKLQYVLKIKDIPSVEGRNAELMLFRRRPKEAEAILLQGGLIYRAIRLNIRLFNWDRALELAESYKTHVDTVLAYRERYLKSLGRTESGNDNTSQRFKRYQGQIEVDWPAVKAKINQEKQKEKQERGRPYA